MGEIINIILKVVNSLETIEVRGKNNLALLFNSIDTLHQLADSLNNPKEEIVELVGTEETDTVER